MNLDSKFISSSFYSNPFRTHEEAYLLGKCSLWVHKFMAVKHQIYENTSTSVVCKFLCLPRNLVQRVRSWSMSRIGISIAQGYMYTSLIIKIPISTELQLKSRNYEQPSSLLINPVMWAVSYQHLSEGMFKYLAYFPSDTHSIVSIIPWLQL